MNNDPYFYILVTLGLIAVGFIIVTLLGSVLYGVFKSLTRTIRKLSKYDKCILVAFASLAIMYGGSKSMWSLVRSHGGDTDLNVTGIYTGISNNVVTVDGVVTTNAIKMCRIEAFGNITLDTPIWVRMSDTNEWTQLTKESPVLYTEGSTNIVEFVVNPEYYNYVYWFAGVDTPAVIRPLSGITITDYHADGNGVTFYFTCDIPQCTQFDIKWKYSYEPDSAFRLAASGTESPITVPGFWVNRNIDWRISSQYLAE